MMTGPYMPRGSQTTGQTTLSPIAALPSKTVTWLSAASPSSSQEQPADGAVSPVFHLEVLNRQSFHC